MLSRQLTNIALLMLVFVYAISLPATPFTTQFNSIDPLSEEWQQAGCYNNSIEFNNGQYPQISQESVYTTASNLTLNEYLNQNSGTDINTIQKVTIPPGTYTFTETLSIPSNIILSGSNAYKNGDDMAGRTVFEFNFSGQHDQNCIKMNGVQNSGIEDILITRVDEPSYYSEGFITEEEGHNILIKASSNCWIYGVQSYYPVKHHVCLFDSRYISIKGCNFKLTQFHGEGGFGYGVLCEHYTDHCLIENNIFNRCRHAMVVQNSAHDNVFGYNFVSGGIQTSSPCNSARHLTGDLVCHGRSDSNLFGPYHNLFEGNVCDMIWVDNFHGLNGRDNTFLRNKAKDYGMFIAGKNYHISYSDLFTNQVMSGFLWLFYHYYSDVQNQPRQNLVNNYLKCPGWSWSYLGLGRAFFSQNSMFEKNTVVRKSNFWGQLYTRTWGDGVRNNGCAEAWRDKSYYLNVADGHIPEFWPQAYAGNWPYDPRAGRTPAQNRAYMTKKTLSRYYSHDYTNTYFLNSETVGSDRTLEVPADLANSTGSLHDLYQQNGNNLRIRQGALLIVDPGITINLNSGASIIAEGSIEINGTGDQPVLINDSAHNGSVIKIVRQSCADSLLTNVSFTHVNSNAPIYLSADNSDNMNLVNISLDNCSFSGISVDTDFGAIGAVDLNNLGSSSSEVTFFANCTDFSNCHSNMGGGAICLRSVTASVSKCAFKNNYSTDGGAIYANYGPLTVSNSLFFQNHSSQGGAIHCAGGTFINNSFISNYSTNICGAMYCHSGRKSYVINNLFWRNLSRASSPTVNYTNVPLKEKCIELGFDIAHLDASDYDYFMMRNNYFYWPDNVFSGSYLRESLPNRPPIGIYCYEQTNPEANYGCFLDLDDSFHSPYLTDDGINTELGELFGDYYHMEHGIIKQASVCYNNGMGAEALATMCGDGVEYPETDIYGKARICYDLVDIGAFEVQDCGLRTSNDNTELELGNVDPDSNASASFTLVNSNTETISGLSFSASDDIADCIAFSNLPTSIAAGDSVTVKFSFSPQKMFKKYAGNIIVSCYSGQPDGSNPRDIRNITQTLRIPISAFSAFHPGYNWVSLPFVSFSNLDLFDIIDPFGISVATPTAVYKYNQAATGNHWGNLGSLNNTTCYKIEMSEDLGDCYIPALGDTLLANSTYVNLHAAAKNWVGYWLNDSQDLDDAFGTNFQYVTSIQAEDWAYCKEVTNPKSDPDNTVSPLPSTKIRPLHYGRGYIVTVSQDISNFKWARPAGVISISDPIEKSKSFSYKQTSDYNVVDLIDLSDNIEEVGAYVDTLCVGAAVVKNGQAQILAYVADDDSLSRGASDLYFKLVYKNRAVKTARNYWLYDAQTDSYNSTQANTKMEYCCVSFFGYHQSPATAHLHVEGNYPNPFNPSTTIKFNMPQAGKAELAVYNVRGQKVRTLVNDTRPQGVQTVVFNGRDDAGNTLASGVYLYRLEAVGKSITKKMLLLK